MTLNSVIAELLSFGNNIFPWFFMFLVVLYCCLYIWSNKFCLKFLLVAFRWGILFIGVVIVWGFLHQCMGTSALFFLLPFVVEFLSFYIIWFLHLTWLLLEIIKFVVSPLPTDPCLFPDCTGVHTCCHIQEYTQQAGGRVKRGVGLTLRVKPTSVKPTGLPADLLRRSLSEVLPVTHG